MVQNISLSGYKLLQLRLKMDESNGLPQVKANYGQGGKFDASMTHALRLMVTADILEEVQNSPDQMKVLRRKVALEIHRSRMFL